MAQFTTYQNRIIVSFPETQYPMSAEITITPMVKAIVSNFSGQLTNTVWPSQGYITLDLTYPPLTADEATAFLNFFESCEGQQACFQLPSLLTAILPPGYGNSGYFQLASNMNQFSVNVGAIYGTHFVIREVLANA